jgi:hypothetical protein
MEEFLNVVRLNENVYYLNSEGRERVGAQKALKKTHQITHHLLRNSLYIAYGCPSTWQSEVQIKIDGKVFLVADAMFDMAGTKNIIEVDHTQKMNENRNKIKKYKHLLELGVFQKEPKFIWVTATEYRKKQILKACEGMKVRVYLASEFN